MARISNFSIIDKLGKNIDEAVSLDEALTKSGLTLQVMNYLANRA